MIHNLNEQIRKNISVIIIAGLHNSGKRKRERERESERMQEGKRERERYMIHNID